MALMSISAYQPSYGAKRIGQVPVFQLMPLTGLAHDGRDYVDVTPLLS